MKWNFSHIFNYNTFLALTEFKLNKYNYILFKKLAPMDH